MNRMRITTFRSQKYCYNLVQYCLLAMNTVGNTERSSDLQVFGTLPII